MMSSYPFMHVVPTNVWTTFVLILCSLHFPKNNWRGKCLIFKVLFNILEVPKHERVGDFFSAYENAALHTCVFLAEKLT